MSYRYMRILVMFDIPIATAEDKRTYRLFRKYLLQSGYLMMQESIYIKLVLNQTNAQLAIRSLYRNKPSVGLVQALTITEKQFSKMEYIIGTVESDVIDSTDRMVIL